MFILRAEPGVGRKIRILFSQQLENLSHRNWMGKIQFSDWAQYPIEGWKKRNLQANFLLEYNIRGSKITEPGVQVNQTLGAKIP